MNRCIKLIVGLGCLTMLFMMFPFDTLQSQTKPNTRHGEENYCRGLSLAANRLGCQEAMTEFNKAIEINPNDARYYTSRSECRSFVLANTSVEVSRRLEPRVKAEVAADLGRAIELDPRYAPAYFARAVTNAT